ncbi:MAG: SdpI family protein [Patescibacteria group bacterium]|jgi:uncharacterized membrane protein
MNNPIKPTLKSEIIPLVLIIATILLSIFFYPMLPEKMISHWDFQGQANGWMPKLFNTILFPCIITACYLLFLVMPYFDPRKERYAEFRGAYNIFKIAIIGVLFIVYLASLLANLGLPINIGKIVSLVIGLLMIILGNYMSKIKFNWFMGIRTPWTMSSEVVWNKTHRVGGWFFILFGLCIIISPYLPVIWATIIFIGGVLLATVGSMVYSYIVYRQEQK